LLLHLLPFAPIPILGTSPDYDKETRTMKNSNTPALAGIALIGLCFIALLIAASAYKSDQGAKKRWQSPPCTAI
jgi:hypothetical protein